MINFEEKLRKLRESKELSQKQLAAKFGLSNKSVSKYEIGSVEPKIDIILKYIELFEVDANYLLGVKNLYREKHVVVSRMDMKTLDNYYALSEERKVLVDLIFEQNKNEKPREVGRYLYINDRD